MELSKQQHFEKMLQRFLKQSKERQRDFMENQNKLIRKRKRVKIDERRKDCND